MRRQVPRVGPVGRRVARNVKRWREQRSKSELSGWLELIGRPIAVSGLTRVEQCERAVDVDDLVALAIRLGVPPNALLFGSDASEGDDPLIELTPLLSQPSHVVWQWANGEEGLLEAGADNFNERWRRERLTRLEAAGKRNPYSVTFAEVSRHEDALWPVLQAAQKAVDDGVPREVLVAALWRLREPEPRSAPSAKRKRERR